MDIIVLCTQASISTAHVWKGGGGGQYIKVNGDEVDVRHLQGFHSLIDKYIIHVI